MYNKLARPAFLRFGLPLQWWLGVLMPAVARVTWHDNFEVSLLLVPCNSVTGEELNRRESLYSNQSTCPVIFTTYELKPVIIDSLRNILYAVCLYSAYREFDTLPLLLYYELLIIYIILTMAITMYFG